MDFRAFRRVGEKCPTTLQNTNPVQDRSSGAIAPTRPKARKSIGTRLKARAS
jgi:hypothetical protein